MENLKIILTAVDAPLAAAWRRWCGDLGCVELHHGSIFDVTCDAVVSPANSFGFMDGGIDRLYTERFGPGVQERNLTPRPPLRGGEGEPQERGCLWGVVAVPHRES
ncbi:MAG: hypothetical protein ACRC33_31965, partial [Gemmataceae bacterium]